MELEAPARGFILLTFQGRIRMSRCEKTSHRDHLAKKNPPKNAEVVVIVVYYSARQ